MIKLIPLSSHKPYMSAMSAPDFVGPLCSMMEAGPVNCCLTCKNRMMAPSRTVTVTCWTLGWTQYLACSLFFTEAQSHLQNMCHRNTVGKGD